jgi:hypothetical protein
MPALTVRTWDWVTAFSATLIGIQLLRFALVLPDWIRDDAPAYPGQYEGRLLNSITTVGILAAVIISRSTVFKTAAGRLGYWLLLGSGLASQLVLLAMDR